MMSGKIVSVALAAGVALSAGPVVTEIGPAYAVSKALQNEARAACKKKYGKSPTSVQISKDLKNVTCVYGSGKSAKSMTRSEAYNYCRDTYHATSIIVVRPRPAGLAVIMAPTDHLRFQLIQTLSVLVQLLEKTR